MTPVGAEERRPSTCPSPPSTDTTPSPPPPSIRALEPPTNERVVDLLERYLEKAKRGELLSVAFVGLLAGGEGYVFCARMTGTRDAVSLAGEAGLLQRSLLDLAASVVEDDVDDA